MSIETEKMKRKYDKKKFISKNDERTMWTKFDISPVQFNCNFSSHIANAQAMGNALSLASQYVFSHLQFLASITALF